MEQIIQLLQDHNVEIEISDGHVFAEEPYTLNGIAGCEWVDVTNWTIEDVNVWLGY